jgi:hypothetical protein
MSDTVFVGPSLTRSDVEELLPGATVLPPIRHGDLIRLRPRRGDRVLIVDGLFLQSAPVRHREILAALQEGVVVAGASSMGALRAAELWRYGMRGVGAVFELLRDGTITDDDEVAVAYGPAEDGYPLLSQPLVDLRLQLRAAVAAQVIGVRDADRLLALMRSLPFRARGVRALLRAADGAAAATAFADWHRSHPFDAKRADARALLGRAADGDLAPAGSGDSLISHVTTWHLRRWQSRHRGATVGGTFAADRDTAALIMACHPDFPALHRHRILAELGCYTEDSVIRMAADRGLALDSEWLAPGERELSTGEAFTRMLVRAFGTRICEPPGLDVLPAALAAPEVVTPARQFVAAAARANDRLPLVDGPGSARLSFRAAAVDALCCQLWHCSADELTTIARDRGFLDLTRLRAMMEPFAALLHVHGAPKFAAAGVGSAIK